jgi:TolA-binding protein
VTDPERLRNEAESPNARTLLSAARDEQPSEALLERTLLAVGAGSAVFGASAGASAATTATSAKASGLLGAAKWLGVGALGGALLTTAAYETRDALRPAAPLNSTVTPAVNRVSEPRALPEHHDPAKTEDLAEPTATQRAAVPLAPAGAATSTPKAERDRALALAAEVAALDAARQALSGGDPSRALSLLDAYRNRFPEAQLLPEALHIRMEALYARGDRAAAARIAERLLAGFPLSPHVARARRIAAEAER